MTNTSAAFTFAPETDARGYGGSAPNIASAISGAWELSRYTESFVVIKDHRDHAEGIGIARVGVEWLDTLGAEERDYDAELSGEQEPPTVRQTVCGICELDVEVALDDIGLSTTDRGGSARCPGGTAHDPLLDPEDWDAHEYHTGAVAH